MKLKRMNFPKWLVLAMFAVISTHAFAEGCPSDLPESARAVVEQGNWKVVQPLDLPVSDARIFKNAHQGQCPGVAAGNFYSKADSSFLVALIQQDSQNNLIEKLVLVTLKKGRMDTIETIPPTQVTKPSVVWKLPPGHYAGVDGTRAHISRDSFVYEQVISTATQYYYDGSHLRSFIISR
jgi:hypothetical protein